MAKLGVFEIKEYMLVPPQETIIAAIKEWMKANEKEGTDEIDNKELKAGKFHQKNNELNRYGANEKWFELTQKSILWRGNGEQLAINIEQAVKDES
jgi:hypothetical protein